MTRSSKTLWHKIFPNAELVKIMSIPHLPNIKVPPELVPLVQDLLALKFPLPVDLNREFIKKYSHRDWGNFETYANACVGHRYVINFEPIIDIEQLVEQRIHPVDYPHLRRLTLFRCDSLFDSEWYEFTNDRIEELNLVDSPTLAQETIKILFEKCKSLKCITIAKKRMAEDNSRSFSTFIKTETEPGFELVSKERVISTAERKDLDLFLKYYANNKTRPEFNPNLTDLNTDFFKLFIESSLKRHG